MTRTPARTPARARVRAARLLVLALVLPLLLSGCGRSFDVYSLPLPGGPDLGDDPITVTARFRDVLDLVPRSTVKVDDVTVGEVTDVRLAQDGETAVVTMRLRSDTDLPADPVAQLRQTSLLGEKFVELDAPTDGGTGSLADGAVIGLADTGRNPEVEEVLGALSLVLNGGGVAQLKTIATELNTALDGREGDARDLLLQVRTLVRTLDDNKADIVDAIERLDRLAKEVRRQQPSIDSALEELPSALTSLNRQRDDLVRMLKALDQLSDVGVRVIRETQASTVATLRNLRPVLGELANSGDALVKSFNVFLTYPFVDEVVGRNPQVARNLHMGDYTNLSIEMDLDLSLGIPGLPTEIPTALPTLVPSEIDPTKIVDDVAQCIASGDLTSKACQAVLADAEALAQLREDCAKPKNADATVCVLLNQVPGLPGGGSSSSGSGNGGVLPSILPSVSIPGLGRAGVDALRTPAQVGSGSSASSTEAGSGVTMGQLSTAFDADLVALLVPGMVPGTGSAADGQGAGQ
ncbi:MCE family protein [Nocardioides sp. GY 10127]|uniref:MCE family protein n=1 Tax=Nocardioides sp. GY 10127 TaxID=2569762 RepID=UPI0010A7BE8E|nr:MCE family protein [Nocardioides sp. GY 10127]TIC79946.1 MCE family protein [Nocardioides sp. GY 10127]